MSENSIKAVTTILHTEQKRAWFSQLPVDADRVSIGLVFDSDHLLRERGTREEVFREELQRCPGLMSQLDQNKATGKLHVAKKFSYTTTRHAGGGWILVGDAFGFLDPIYSTVVFLALRSGELAPDCIVEGLKSGDLSERQLSRWTGDFKRGVTLFHKLVDAFYANEFSFARFLEEHPEHRGNLTDLLIGRAFCDESGRIFHDL